MFINVLTLRLIFCQMIRLSITTNKWFWTIFTAIFMLGFSSKLQAQYIPAYTFSQSSGTYTALSSPNVLASGAGYDDERYYVVLPFTFMMDNVPYNSVYVAMNGFVSFGFTDPGTDYWIIASTTTGFSSVSGFDYNLGSLNANTELSYQTIGTTPNRKFVAQWKNMGRVGTNVLDASFQIRLHETSNVLEIVYGNISLSTGSNISVQIGLRDVSGALFNNRSSSNSNWNNTSAGSTVSSNVFYNGGSNPSNGQTYTFTPPPTCTLPNLPSNLLLNGVSNSVTGSFNASVPAASKYLVVRTQNGPLNTMPVDGQIYSGTIGNGTIVQNNSATTFVNGGLIPLTNYRYTIIPYNDGSCMGPVYNTSNLLYDFVWTQGPRKYVWIPTNGSADFQLATNWSPNRVFTNAMDTLVFNQGGQVAVTNIPTHSVSGLQLGNNTEITMTSATSDSIIIGNYFNIPYGTSLTLDGANLLKIAFKNAAGQRQTTINGKLILNGNSKFNTRYSKTNVTGTVQINNANAIFYNDCITCYNDSIFFLANSHLDLNRDSSYIPQAYFDSTSTLQITGIINHGPTMSNTPMSTILGKLIIDCPQSVASMSIPAAIQGFNGKVIIKNTGSGSLSTNYVNFNGNVEMWKGNLIVFNGTFFNRDVFLDTGKVSFYAAGAFRGDLTTTPMDTMQVYSTNSSIGFIGPGHQHVTILGQYIGGSHIFLLDNPSGATFTGTINFTGSDVSQIDEGSWTGPGVFNFGNNNKLVYNHLVSHIATATEWPIANGPSSVTVNLEAPSPFNRFYLPGNRNVSGTFQLDDGVVVLDNNNLSVGQLFNVGISDTNQMIVTNGTGNLYVKIPTGISNTLYPLGDLDGVHEFSPVELSLNANPSVRYIGMHVTDALHPNVSGVNPISRYWNIVDTAANPSYTYNVKIAADSTDVLSPNIQLQTWNGSNWQMYPGYFVNDSLKTSAFISGTSYPISRAFTGFDLSFATTPSVYTWNGSVNTDYQNAANWTPLRNTPATTDQLVFSNGLLDSITNIPVQTIGRFTVLNQTTVKFYPFNTYNVTLSIQSDNDTTTNELFVGTGSSLYLIGVLNKIKFNGIKNTCIIDGRLELVNVNYSCQIDFTNCQAIVSSSGILASGGSTTDNPFISSASNLHVYGTYENKYTTTHGYIPFASWEDGSNVNVIGILSIPGIPTIANGLHQNFYNFTYNCPNQYGTVGWVSDTVKNHLTIISTGTSTLTTSFLQTNDFIQTGGKVLLGSTCTVSDSVYQTGGTMNTTSITYPTYLVFNGQSSQQYFSCHDSSFSGRFNYIIQNPYGVHLVGTGNLVTNPIFNIRYLGGITVKVNAVQPINTNLTIEYDSLGSSLSYAYHGNVTAESICYPAVKSPTMLEVDLGNLHTLSLPFDRIISDELVMKSGNIDIQNHTLTLGDSLNYNGTLTHTSGYIVSTTGYFKRWMMNLNLHNYSSVAFPLSDGQHNRMIYLASSVNNPVTNIGTLSARHQALAGSTSGLNITDASYTITDQTNALWDIVPGNGFAITGTLDVQVIIDGMNLANAVGSLRLMNSNPILGNHVNSSGYVPAIVVERNSLSLSDLTAGSFHIGFTPANLSNLVYSVASGSWNNPSTWNINAVPNNTHDVIVSVGDSVYMNSTAEANSLFVSQLALFDVMSDSIHVNMSVANSGSFILHGGVCELGPQGGGNRQFINSDSLFIYGGILRVNGMFHSGNVSFVQTGGAIIEDGNSAVNGSYSGTYINMVAGHILATGGFIQIIDPQLNSYDVFYGGGMGPGHTLILGDGISIATGNSYGFSLYSNNSLGNVVVNSTPSTLNRHVQLRQNATLFGDLTLNNADAYFNMNGLDLFVAGDITLDTATTFITNGNLSFSNYNLMYQQNSIVSITQHLINHGTIQNLNSNPTATFKSLFINNGSVGGVRFDIGDFTYSGTLTLQNGKLSIGNNSTVTGLTGQTVTAIDGWIYGRLKMYISTTNYGTNYFPIGDSLRPSMIQFSVGSGSTQTVTSPGYVTAQAITYDHPNIASSSIDPNHSINRYYIIDTSGGIRFSNGYGTFRMYYKMQDADPLAFAANFIYARYNGGTWTEEIPLSVSNQNINSLKDFRFIKGEYIIGENHNAPIINTQASDQNVCSLGQANFSIVSSGLNQFQWEVNTGSGWSVLMNNTFYAGVHSSNLQVSNIPITFNNYQYRCLVSNVFGSIYSNPVTLHVGSGVVPTLQISSTSGTTICASDQVNFTTNYSNGGNSPAFEWYINNVPQGINSPTILLSGLQNNDVVTCQMISSSGCANPTQVTSNAITMTVNPMIAPLVSIVANPGSSICVGDSVTFTATATNGGSAPTYVWRKNGTYLGNGSTYTSTSINNGNSIYCILTSNAACLSTNLDTSNVISMSVSNPVTPNVTITASPNTTICNGTAVTFTATPTNGGSAANYQWLKNGSPVGANSITYVDNALVNTDQITCVLESSLGCVTKVNDTSNVLTMTVNPILTPQATISVSPSDTICAGTLVTFNTVVSNAGTSTNYKWYLNNTLVYNGLNYTITTLSNGGVVKLVINTNPVCASTNIDTSNEITMVVNATVTPSVIISANPGSTICNGDSVTYTAVPQFGGTAPIFQWKKNNINVGTNNPIYGDNSIINGDVITCEMLSNEQCTNSPNVISNSITMSTLNMVAPSISITANPGTSICTGTSVNFTASINNGGSSPTYQWQLNGNNVGGNFSSYGSSTLNNGDVIHCFLTSNQQCVSPTNVKSDSLVMLVTPSVTPSVNISANPGTSISAGTQVTFTAVPINGGSTPSYQWKLNASLVGTNSDTYITSSLVDGDDITCDLVSNDPCAAPVQVSSNHLKMTIATSIGELAADFSDIYIYPNPTNGLLILEGQLKSTSDRMLQYQILSMTGQSIQSGELDLVQTHFSKPIQFDESVSSGVYMLKLTYGNQSAYYRIQLMR